ncbi:MAG: ABC transporter substrate-binding protein [Clostridiales bacterium]|nr:ABC transporter substrate-binding protein [Clostridiales bacterium]
MKRIVGCVLAAIMILSCAACGNGNSEASESQAGNPAVSDAANPATGNGKIEVTVGVSADFGGLDPFGSASTIKTSWTPAVYQTLFVLDEYGGTPESVLVDNYTRVDDTTFDITIYDYIYDSAGNNITASDVKYSYDYAKACGTVTKMHYVDSVEVTGDYTVRLKTSSNSIGVWQYALTNVYIVSEKAHTESGDSFATSNCGTGPYAIGEYTPSSTLELIKRDDYWQTDDSLTPPMYKTNADRVIYNVISESTQMGIAMENGSIDMILTITGSEVSRFADAEGKAYDGYNVYGTLNTLIDCMFFNMDNGSIFADNLALRQAILYAIDKAGLVTVAVDGRGEQCYAFGSSVYADYLDEWIGHDYFNQDIEKAKSLLAESGYAQTTPIRIMYQNNDQYKAEAEMIQAYLLEIGLQCQLLGYDTSLFNEYKYNSAEWDIKLDPCKSPDQLPNLWGYCLDSNNYENGTTNFIHSDELQQMTVAISTEEGHTEEAIRAYEKYLEDNAWLIGLIDPYQYCIAKDSVTNILINAKTYCSVWACDFADNFVGVASK